jgi:hypothetical protein
MSNLSDKDIDRLSREAADSFEPDHDSLSWSRLEQMLTEQMPERPPDGFRFGRVHPYIWGPAVVFIAGISFYLIKSKIYSKNSTPVTQTVIQIPTSPASEAKGLTTGGKAGDAQASSSHVEPGSDKTEKQTASAAGEGLQGVTDSRETKTVGSSVALTSADHNRQQGGANASTNSSGPSAKGRRSAIQKSAVLGANAAAFTAASADMVRHAAATGTAMKESSSLSQDQVATKSWSLPALGGTGAKLGTITGNDSLLNHTTLPKKVPAAKSMRINRSLNFGLAFGPDYTDAGGISNNQFGNNIGITVGYYLTGKLSINTGIFYSNKFYWSPGQAPNRASAAMQYAPPNNSMTLAAAPTFQYVNGSADLYEIPLTLRYDVARSGKSKFFVNAGLSSYFIVNQTNIYFFHSGGLPAAWKRTDNSQYNYWFGVGNLSAGIETDMGKGFSFQAEPFLKLPFQSMGIENVRLHSYGFLLSFRYTPVLSRSKK